jgi:hypothetical protein
MVEQAEQRRESTGDSSEHVIAVTREDNGELAEDVVAAEDARSDSRTKDGTGGRVADRVVETSPAPPAEGRERPDDPVPGTLPRP